MRRVYPDGMRNRIGAQAISSEDSEGNIIDACKAVMMSGITCRACVAIAEVPQVTICSGGKILEVSSKTVATMMEAIDLEISLRHVYSNSRIQNKSLRAATVICYSE